MSILCAYQFEIQTRQDQSAAACLASLQHKFAVWVEAFFRSKTHRVSLPFDGTSLFPAEGHRIWTCSQECDGHRLIRLEWEFVDAQEAKVVWSLKGPLKMPAPERDTKSRNRTSLVWGLAIRLVCDNRTVGVHVAIQASFDSGALRPLPEHLNWPDPLKTLRPLLGEILRGESCHVYGEPVPTDFQLVKTSEIEEFVGKCLLNPSRVLPVVAISFNELFIAKISNDLVEPGTLQRVPTGLYAEPTGPGPVRAFQDLVVGLARVVFLGCEAAACLTRLLGPERSCEGGIRHYWPGFQLDAAPERHPFIRLQNWPQNLVTTVPAKTIFAMLADQSAKSFQIEPWLRPTSVELALDQRDKRKQAVALAATLSESEGAMKALRQTEEQLQKQHLAACEQVSAMKKELADLRIQWSAFQDAACRRLPAWEGKIDKLAEELERTWDENERLRGDLELARRQLKELKTELQNAKQRLIWSGKDTS